MTETSVRSLVLLTLFATACSSTPHVMTPSGTPPVASATIRLASEPPLFSPDGRLHFVLSTPSNELRAEDAATGTVRWTLSQPPLPDGSQKSWRVLVSDDGASVYVQSLHDAGTPTYLGTRRIDARTGAESASDIKQDTYWYEDVVLWTALRGGGELQMAIRRAAAAGGGYRLRTLDPLTLAIRADITQAAAPPRPGP